MGPAVIYYPKLTLKIFGIHDFMISIVLFGVKVVLCSDRVVLFVGRVVLCGGRVVLCGGSVDSLQMILNVRIVYNCTVYVLIVSYYTARD